MNQYEMVMIIVLIVAVASVLKSRNQARHRRSDDESASDRDVRDDNVQLQNEVKALKDRIAVLERLATDDQRNLELDREIAKLRDHSKT